MTDYSDSLFLGLKTPSFLEKPLRDARAMIAGGWSEPHSTNTQGEYCSPYDEGVAKFCVQDAIALAAVSIADHQMAEMWLAKVAGFGPLGMHPLQQWLEHPQRKLTEVVALFDKATLAAKAIRGAA